MQQPTGRINLSPMFAEIHHGDAAQKLVLDSRGITTRWFDAGESLEWKVRVFRPGT